MPFDVLPQEQEVKVGQFQKFADAMLRGCAATEPGMGQCFRGDEACAMGAMWIGEGRAIIRDFNDERDIYLHFQDVASAYCKRYGKEIYRDNDSGRFTREQIAARIAAL